MDTTGIENFVNGKVPEIMLIIAGVIALAIVYTYINDKESTSCKILTIIGVIAGIAIILIALTRYKDWALFDAILVMVAGFALFIRPFTKLNVAIIIALLVMGFVYLYLGTLSGDLSFLNSGWPRIIIALVAGAMVYMVLNFIQVAVQTVGKIINCWPILAVFGIICIAEGILLLCGYSSLYYTFVK